MLEKIGFIRNPLTIIAIFAMITEIGFTAIVLFSPELQSIFIWFIMIFPMFLVSLFFITLNFNPRVLYAPSDFQDEQIFKELIEKGQTFTNGMDMIEEVIDKVSDKLTPKEDQPVALSDSPQLSEIKEDIQELKLLIPTVKTTAKDIVDASASSDLPYSKNRSRVTVFRTRRDPKTEPIKLPDDSIDVTD